MTIHLDRRMLTFIGALAAVALVLLLLAGFPASTLLWFGLILACPLMMLFMHGGHGAGEHRDDSGRRESSHTPGGYH